MERVLHRGSMDDCVDLFLGIEHHNRFLHHGSMEKFLHCGSVEMLPLKGLLMFLCRDSVEKFLQIGRAHV